MSKMSLILISLDTHLVDKCAKTITNAVKSTGGIMVGPIPLRVRNHRHIRRIDLYTSANALTEIYIPKEVELIIK